MEGYSSTLPRKPEFQRGNVPNLSLFLIGTWVGLKNNPYISREIQGIMVMVKNFYNGSPYFAKFRIGLW